jgi:hypothetical protein
LVDVQTIGVLVTAASVTVAAIYYTINMRTTIQTRQAQLFMPLFSHMYSDPFMRDYRTIMSEWQWKDYDEFMQKYGYLGLKEECAPLAKIMTYLEGIGVLMKNRLIDPKLLDDQFSSLIIWYWERYGPILKHWEVSMNSPELAEFTELLYNRVKPIRQEQRRRKAAMGQEVKSSKYNASGELHPIFKNPQ